MKRKVSIALVTALLALTLLWSIGCGGGGKVTNSPSPALTPVMTAKLTPLMTPSPAPDLSPGTSPGISPAVIEGFIEGGEVDAANVPEVTTAVEGKYPDATIKTITYATYNGEQVYAVELEGAEAQKVYVRPDGTLVENGAAG